MHRKRKRCEGVESRTRWSEASKSAAARLIMQHMDHGSTGYSVYRVREFHLCELVLHFSLAKFLAQ
jgi:hypothetical protein